MLPPRTAAGTAGDATQCEEGNLPEDLGAAVDRALRGLALTVLHSSNAPLLPSRSQFLVARPLPVAFARAARGCPR